MKKQLMIQSLSPIALLTIVKNWSFIIKDDEGVNLALKEFVCANLPLLCIILLCVIWCVLAIVFIISFNAFKYADRKQGYSIAVVEKKEDASLNFFFTLILPLVIDNLNTWQGVITFFLILIFTWLLMARTKLFYANPVLSIIGYHVTEIAFVENKEKGNSTYVAISYGEIDEKHNVEYKDITKDVLFVKGMKK